MNALHRIAHDYKQSGPIVFGELAQSSHDPCVNPLFVRLPQTHHQDAAMLLVAVLGESLVRRDEHPLLGLDKGPKLVIEHSLTLSATDVENVMTIALSS